MIFAVYVIVCSNDRLNLYSDAKKTLPKPKVGDYCTVAMEQGFSDACFGLCTNQPPVNRVSQTCRAASMEMPRPTVRRWCEHGYNVAFDKTVQDLKTYFTVSLNVFVLYVLIFLSDVIRY